MAEENCGGDRHLFIKIDGKFYFISAECLGKPLDCEGDEDKAKKIEAMAEAFIKAAQEDGSIARVEFAVWLKRCEVLYSLMGSKS